MRDYLNKHDEIYSIAVQLFEEMMQERLIRLDRPTALSIWKIQIDYINN